MKRATRLAQRLTRRERDIARLVTRGLCNREIANELGLALGTVKTHIHTILLKFGIASRVSIVNLFHGSRSL